LNEHKLNAADSWFKRFGDGAVFLCQLLPIARDLISLPAGVARMGPGRFALMSLLGSVPFCFLLALVGLLSGPAWGSAIELVDQYDLLIVALVLLPFLAYGVYRWRARRRDSPTDGRP
jgi:membrane protein DedA with SNARE-associated domain